MPVSLIATKLLLGPEAQTFGAFGAFVIVNMISFEGRAASRMIAWGIMVVTGCLLIGIGTAASTAPVAAVAVAGLVSFAIFFGGVVNPYVAAAKRGAILMLALPLMDPGGTSVIGTRVLGWLLACAICIPAVVLIWRRPWISDLRRRCGDACGELSRLLVEPTNTEAVEGSRTAVWEMVESFTGTPNRPTGSSGSSAALSRVVDQLSWLFDMASHPDGQDGAGREAAVLRRSATDLLTTCAAVLAGEESELRTDDLKKVLGRFERSTNEEVLAFAGASAGDGESLDHLFRLSQMGETVMRISEAVAVIGARERKMGLVARLRVWASTWAPEEMRDSARMLRENSALRSTWLRNSLRGAIGIALAVLVAELLSVQNSFWVVLGTLSILRSDALGTRQSALRAMAGTIVGIVIGAGFILAIGSDKAVLWACFPVAVLVAVYTRKAFSFAVGQASFAAMVIILYNLTAPVGWEIGLVRVQDVAISCAICLFVGLLVWPRGATALILESLGASYREAAALLAQRARSALSAGSDSEGTGLRERAATANARLDAALRQFLDEPGDHPLKSADLVALCAGGIRLACTSNEIDLIRSAEWFAHSSRAASTSLDEAIESVSDWYRTAGELLGAGRPLSEPVSSPSLSRELRGRQVDAGDVLGGFWVGESITSLAELSWRYVERSQILHARRRGGW